MERQFRLNWQALIEEAKHRRKKLKLTQATLATLANISAPSVSHFENGDKYIQLSTALSILTVLGMTDDRALQFIKMDAYYHPDRCMVIFKGYDNDTIILCGISLEALQDHFDLNAKKNPMQTFKTNLSSILYIAKKKYLSGKVELDGSVLVKTADL